MPIKFVDLLDIHPICSNILDKLSDQNKLRLAFANNLCATSVLDNLNELNIISVPHQYVAHAHAGLMHKRYVEAREEQVNQFIKITQEFWDRSGRFWNLSPAPFWNLSHILFDSQWIDSFRAYCRSVHIPCPIILSWSYVDGVLEDIMSVADSARLCSYEVIKLCAEAHVNLWYPKPEIILE